MPCREIPQTGLFSFTVDHGGYRGQEGIDYAGHQDLRGDRGYRRRGGARRGRDVTGFRVLLAELAGAMPRAAQQCRR
ncbi:MAG: hypothetical protein J2P26_03480 [Nocardiopsaceae bacterium]|nr:hypothetical protein [Nocardiopsaceae bacterium]